MSASTTWQQPAPATLLRLGRVSNLPTVWTNCLAATALAGGDTLSLRTASVVCAVSLLYLAGMYLNDAFDREIDAVERPTRPIPAGLISPQVVFAAGFGMLAVGVVLLAMNGVAAGVAGLALAGTIVLYDWHHKQNPLSPVLMGLCRFLVYVTAAAAAGGSGVGLLVLPAACAMFAHVVGLTYAAKQESLDRIDRMWPLAVLALPLALAVPTLGSGGAPLLTFAFLLLADVSAVAHLKARTRPGAVPRAVGALIAAVALVDAVAVAPLSPTLALVCVGGYALTRLAHRIIPGT